MTQASTPQALKPFSESMFNMWRCVICMAHADGFVHEKERELFSHVFASMRRVYDMKPGHLAALTKDIDEPQDVDGLLPLVTDPECQSLLIFFSQVVACADDKFEFEEAELVGRLDGAFGALPETAETVAAIREEITSRMREYNAEGQGTDLGVTYHALEMLLGRLGVTLLD